MWSEYKLNEYFGAWQKTNLETVPEEKRPVIVKRADGEIFEAYAWYDTEDETPYWNLPGGIDRIEIEPTDVWKPIKEGIK